MIDPKTGFWLSAIKTSLSGEYWAVLQNVTKGKYFVSCLSDVLTDIADGPFLSMEAAIGARESLIRRAV